MAAASHHVPCTLHPAKFSPAYPFISLFFFPSGMVQQMKVQGVWMEASMQQRVQHWWQANVQLLEPKPKPKPKSNPNPPNPKVTPKATANEAAGNVGGATGLGLLVLLTMMTMMTMMMRLAADRHADPSLVWERQSRPRLQSQSRASQQLKRTSDGAEWEKVGVNVRGMHAGPPTRIVSPSRMTILLSAVKSSS